MRNIRIALLATGLVAAGPLHAAGVIAVETLPRDKVAQTIQAAPDNAVIEINGQTKTKAQWRGYYQSKFKLLNAATLKAMDSKAKAKFAADAKALQDEQDAAIAQQNAQTEKEFEASSSQ
jgi:hypothetical protein